MGSYYRKVSIKERLPQLGKYVPVIDIKNEIIIYRMVEYNGLQFWNMRDISGTNTPNDNFAMVYWLEEVTSEEEDRLQYLNNINQL